jgi:hypothetical protein
MAHAPRLPIESRQAGDLTVRGHSAERDAPHDAVDSGVRPCDGISVHGEVVRAPCGSVRRVRLPALRNPAFRIN